MSSTTGVSGSPASGGEGDHPAADLVARLACLLNHSLGRFGKALPHGLEAGVERLDHLVNRGVEILDPLRDLLASLGERSLQVAGLARPPCGSGELVATNLGLVE